ncbi:MAG: hypothetical protein NW216_06910 [Hyphomicrobium sp.]|nr:hypothetical protein [Hyphomicrobium sp.]
MHLRTLRALTLAAAATTVSMGTLSASANAQDGGLAGMHDQRRERGRLCMSDHFHSGSGVGKTKEAAKAAAIRSWADFTAFEYGNRWASFSIAGSKGISYTKENAGWSATVEARPCRR